MIVVYNSFFFNFYFYFILLYNTVLVLPYIDMNPPWVYMQSQTWTPLPPPSPQHPSGSSPCTSPKHAVSCIWHRLVILFIHCWVCFANTFLRIFVFIFLRDICCCCCLVIKPYPTLSDSMDCSTPGFPVLYYLLQFAQTHVPWVGDAI